MDQDDDNAEETIEEISRSSELYQSEDDSSNSISENNEVEDEEIVEEDIISDWILKSIFSSTQILLFYFYVNSELYHYIKMKY